MVAASGLAASRSQHSAAEIAGFFASPAAKNRWLLAIFGVSLKSQEARSDHGCKSPQPRDFAAAATTGHKALDAHPNSPQWMWMSNS